MPTPLVDLDHVAASARPIHTLMTAAESLFGSGSGAKKKAWVIKQVVALADEINIPIIPAGLEHELKVAVLGALVELLWGLLFSGRT